MISIPRTQHIDIKTGLGPMRMPAPDKFRLTVNTGRPLMFHSEQDGVTELVRCEHEGFLVLPPGSNPLISKAPDPEPPKTQRQPQMLSLLLEPSLFEEALELMPLSSKALAWTPMNFQPDKPTVHLAKSLAIEMKSGNPHGALFSDQLSMALAIRLIHERTKKPMAPRPGQRNRAALQGAIDLIKTAPEKAMSIEDLSQICGLSRFHFIRLFSAEFGKTPYQYILEMRIDKGKTLLMTAPPSSQSLNLQQVATDCGFTSHSHFCQVFKRETGTSPLRWKKSGRH